MEAIAQSTSDAFKAFGLSMLFLLTTIIFVVGGWILPKGIVTDEAFKVTSDTSKYSCVVSEVDENLLLKCLKVK